ncbi:MAG TPA: hypothetical protein QGF58_15460 [Myxococcota bacterium]|nr:hypothetical protein [Myxococcota bacterium]
MERASPLARLALGRGEAPDEDRIGDAYDHRVLEFHSERWSRAGPVAIELAARCRRSLRQALRRLATDEDIARHYAAWMAEDPPYDLG